MGKINDIAMKLDLQSTSKTHPVFHVSKFKKFKGEINDQLCCRLPTFAVENNHVIMLEKILGRKTILNKEKDEKEPLIQWSGLINVENTSWEKVSTLVDRFPSIRLEVESFSEERGNVTHAATSPKLLMFNVFYL